MEQTEKKVPGMRRGKHQKPLTSELFKLGAKPPTLKSDMKPEEAEPVITTPKILNPTYSSLLGNETSAHEFLKEVNLADSDTRRDNILMNGLRTLKFSKTKPDTTLLTSFMYIAKDKPQTLSSPKVFETILSFLKKEPFKKQSPTLHIFIANLILEILAQSQDWPEVIAHYYIDDAMGDRVWVDLPSCRKFVLNILTGFGHNSALIRNEIEEQEQSLSSQPNSEFLFPGCEIKLRFTHTSQSSIKKYVMTVVNDALQKRQLVSVPKSLNMFLRIASCYPELRLSISKQFEVWLNGVKISKGLIDLLNTIVSVCEAPEDTETITTLVTMRLKTKLSNPPYIAAMQILVRTKENLALCFKQILLNELSSRKNQSTNIPLLQMMFKNYTDECARKLALICQELLLEQDEMLKPLKQLIHELVRQVKQDLNFQILASCLLQERNQEKFRRMETTFKLKYVYIIADLVIWVSVNNAHFLNRDTLSLSHEASKKAAHNMKDMNSYLSIVQMHAISWLINVVSTILPATTTTEQFYNVLIRRLVLFEADWSKEEWPNENERSTLQKMLHQGTILENSLITICSFPYKENIHVTSPTIISLLEKIFYNSLNSHYNLVCTNPDIFENILRLSLLNGETHTDSKDTENFVYCYTEYYWRSWVLLLILSICNLQVLGSEAVKNYPTLSMLIEMCLTGEYKYPTTLGFKHATEMGVLSRESILGKKEEEETIKFSARRFTDDEPQLNLMIYDIHGEPRRPAVSIVDHITELNNSFGLAKQIFQCREPDFLLELIERQGSAGSLKWLSDVLETDGEYSVNALPIISLCELYISGLDEQMSMKAVKKHKLAEKFERRQKTITERLRNVLYLPPDQCETSLTVLSYFLSRLIPPKQTLTSDRQLTLTALESIFETQTEKASNISWLLNGIPNLPSFEILRPNLIQIILSCCRSEFQHDVIIAALTFIDKYIPENLENFILSLVDMLQERYLFFNSCFQMQDLIISTQLLACLHNIILKTTNYIFTHFDQLDTINWIPVHLNGTSIKLPDSLIKTTFMVLAYDSLVNENIGGEEMFHLWFPDCEPFPLQIFIKEQDFLPNEYVLAFLNSSRHPVAQTIVKMLDTETTLKLLTFQGLTGKSARVILRSLDEKVSHSVESLKIGLQNPELGNSLPYLRNLTDSYKHMGYQEGRHFNRFLTETMGIQSVIYPHTSSMLDLQITSFSGEIPAKKISKYDQLDGKSLEQHLLQVFNTRTSCIVNESNSNQALLLRSITSNILENATTNWNQNFTTITMVVNKLHKLVSSNRSGRSVLDALFQKGTWSCPIIKLLCIAHVNQGATREFTETLHFITHYPNQTGSLVPLIHEYFPDISHPLQERLREDPSKLINEIIQKASRDTQKTIQLANQLICLTADSEKFRRFDFNKLMKVLNILEEIEYNKINKLIWHVLLSTLQHGDSQKTLNFILTLLHQQFEQNLVMSLDTPEFGYFRVSVGKYFDCLTLLDPDIGFSAHYTSHKLAPVLFNQYYLPYMLSFFMSELSWEFVSELLLSNGFQSSNTAYLDFLWGSLNAARLWQGRSNLNVVSPLWCFGLRKQYKLEVTDNILNILNRIYNEFKDTVQAMSGQTGVILSEFLDSLDTSESYRKLFFDALYKRIPMLIVLLKDETEKQKNSISFLINKKELLALHFALFLYLIWPETEIPSDLFDTLPLSMSLWHPSVCDTRLHQLLSRLVLPNDTQNSQLKYVLILKKIATKHKTLFLRHLPLLPSFISSNSVSLQSDNIRQNQVLLSQILSLLKLLQPNIYKDIYSESLNAIFTCYFNTFSTDKKSTASCNSLLESMGEMLLAYLSANFKQFYQFIIQHRQHLEGIASNHHSVESIQQIVTSIRYNKPKMLCINNRNFGFIFPEPPAPRTVQLIPFKNRLLRHNSNETILYVLQELEDQSMSRASILVEFAPCLHTLIVHPDQFCRKLATLLSIRHLKLNPSSCAEFIPYILKALTSGDPVMVSGIIKYIPEVVVLCSKTDARRVMRSMLLISAKEFHEVKEELINSIKTCLADKFAC
ncbi:Integrator complex subunit 1-like [Oopsacas minuta]|uniref:Integrator complex subunit 1-like n=1 Tax=Oopsacas minuta TaxID=111878 RepID=A0AAV7K032_9METZ|nr:Integrator complex subunit 1-like [Oopsacas minuta]